MGVRGAAPVEKIACSIAASSGACWSAKVARSLTICGAVVNRAKNRIDCTAV